MCTFKRPSTKDNQFSVCRIARCGASVYAVFVYVYDAVLCFSVNSLLFILPHTSCTI